MITSYLENTYHLDYIVISVSSLSGQVVACTMYAKHDDLPVSKHRCDCGTALSELHCLIRASVLTSLGFQASVKVHGLESLSYPFIARWQTVHWGQTGKERQDTRWWHVLILSNGMIHFAFDHIISALSHVNSQNIVQISYVLFTDTEARWNSVLTRIEQRLNQFPSGFFHCCNTSMQIWFSKLFNFLIQLFISLYKQCVSSSNVLLLMPSS